MSWFFLIVTAIYASAQGYIFLSFQRSLKPRWWILLLAGTWLALMVAGPWAVSRLDDRGLSEVSNWIAPVVYTWMAVTFWAVVGFALLDIWNLLAWLGKQAWAPLGRGAVPPKVRAPLIFALIALATAWGLWEARNIHVRHLEFQADLPEGVEQVRIVQVSDVHLGLHLQEDRLEDILEHIRRLEPDVLVSTGDLVDSSDGRVMPLAGHLARLNAPLGKYGIFGNHEFYAGTELSTEFHNQAGITLLRQEAVEIVDGLWLAGIDDDVGSRRGFKPLADQSEALAQADKDEFILLLKHRPLIENPQAFNLQLSGHTHGGQIWPWHYITAIQFPYVSGTHRLEGDSWLHTSRGTGTWGPSVRLFAPPEITVITIQARR